MNKQKKSNEQRLAQQRLCKRRRYREIKNDPELFAFEREKRRAAYLRRKENQKVTSIVDKAPGRQREQRKKWKENSKNYRQRKKENEKEKDIIEENEKEKDIIEENEKEKDIIEENEKEKDIIEENEKEKDIIEENENEKDIIETFIKEEELDTVDETNIFTDDDYDPLHHDCSACVTLNEHRYSTQKRVKQLESTITVLKKKNESQRKYINYLKNKLQAVDKAAEVHKDNKDDELNPVSLIGTTSFF